MSLEVLKGALCLLVESLLFLAPFSHLRVAVACGIFLGEEGLPGFLHGEDIFKDDDLIELIS